MRMRSSRSRLNRPSRPNQRASRRPRRRHRRNPRRHRKRPHHRRRSPRHRLHRPLRLPRRRLSRALSTTMTTTRMMSSSRWIPCSLPQTVTPMAMARCRAPPLCPRQISLHQACDQDCRRHRHPPRRCGERQCALLSLAIRIDCASPASAADEAAVSVPSLRAGLVPRDVLYERPTRAMVRPRASPS